MADMAYNTKCPPCFQKVLDYLTLRDLFPKIYTVSTFYETVIFVPVYYLCQNKLTIISIL